MKRMKKEFKTRRIKLNSHIVEILEPVNTISVKEFEKEMRAILKKIKI